MKKCFLKMQKIGCLFSSVSFFLPSPLVYITVAINKTNSEKHAGSKEVKKNECLM